MDTPEIYYKVRIEKEGQEPHFEFMTITDITATSRELLKQLLDPRVADAKYVKVEGVFKPYQQWRRRQRGGK